MSPVTPTTFSIPLGLAAHQHAERLRQLQANPRKAKQVYLNTLAVYAVQQYLEYLGIATDWSQSASQDVIQVALSDVAELSLPTGGQLECRPVLPAATQFSIPLPPQSDQIGCVAVQLDAELQQATLLGFVPTWVPPAVPLTQLQPLSALLEKIATRSQQVNLRDWFHHIATAGWQPLEQVIEGLASLRDTPAWAYRSTAIALPETVPALIELFQANADKWTRLQILNLLGCIALGDQTAIAFLTQVLATITDADLRRQTAITLGLLQPDHPQAGVRRARVLEFGLQMHQQRLLLVLTLTPQANEQTEVQVRLHPTVESVLPAQLRLSILDELGNTFLEEQTEGTEDWLQLVFSGQQGDSFRLGVQLDTATLTEAFVI